MVDRVSASITIGGALSFDHFRELLTLIADEDLSLDWDGEPFDPSQLVGGQPLTLMAHEVALGQFIPLEDFCVARGLIFRRWSGACASWGPQRAVYNGTGSVNYLTLNDGGVVLMDRQTIEILGSMGAVFAWFDAADLQVPQLVVGLTAVDATLLVLVKVGALVPHTELEDDDRAVPGSYAIALPRRATGQVPDTEDSLEAAKDIFHKAVPIDNLDDFAIDLVVVAPRDDVPANARWLTEADSLLPILPSRGDADHG